MSGYAKALKGFLQLFPQRIKVTLTHAVTGIKLGTYKIAVEQLPERFNKPTIMEIDGNHWQVLLANPSSADDYTIWKKLTLSVCEPGLPANRFLVPTIPNSSPVATNCGLFNDFILNIETYDWRQMEFLPMTLLPVIQKELDAIGPIISPAGNENLLLGFTSRHIRENVGDCRLSISFKSFCEIIQVLQKGVVRYAGTEALVKDSFVIRTPSYTYYGLLQEKYITELCVAGFGGVDDEFMKVVAEHKLVLIDWCNVAVIMEGSETVVENIQEMNNELLSLD